MLRRHILLGLIPSAALWLAANLLGWNMPGFPEGRRWYFDPFAWQFLFAIAVSLGLTRNRERTLLAPSGWLPRGAIGFAAVAAVVSLSWSIHEAVNWKCGSTRQCCRRRDW